ncbi:DUF1800 domain-containing protein [Exilibacterium tricleocarpae]|uniref:DUF1800 domain-containing protein n=1 Tax=Exilibacterium tricleocarpae TaxID=2591008 RepID=UPI0015D10B65|nr:DUF1800 family protein [Exilibacterium tricleocarpae]
MLFIALFFPLIAFAQLSDIPENQIDITVKKIKASQFLHQATFGPTLEDIDNLAARMATIGDNNALHEWIDNQFSLPFTANESYEQLTRDMIADDGFAVDSAPPTTDGLNYQIQNYKHHAWWNRTLRGTDQLRQRTAWALVQILVISELGMGLNARFDGQWLGIPRYTDLLMQHAFGNYRDILYDVTLSPAMGLYLSHLRNQKGDTSRGIFPDENYAREILQLFSIGVYALQQNGEPLLDTEGRRIETYSNETIRNFARVFTGLSYAPSNGRDDFLRNPRNMFAPMKMYENYHDRGEKTLLNGVALPAGQDGLADINAAIDNIYAHPNVPPFIARLLIQRFTSSNPSPAYINAVADQFSDDGQGNRGNMQAVIRTILMHPEARDTLQITQTRNTNGNYRLDITGNNPTGGKLREPLLTLTALYRAFNVQASHPDGRFRAFSRSYLTNQGINQSPSVFNYYLPDFQPVGVLQDNNLVAPEFQIYTPVMMSLFSNFLRTPVQGRTFGMGENGTLDLTAEENMAVNATALIDRLNLLLSYGTLSSAVVDEIKTTMASTNSAKSRVELMLLTLLTAPDFAIME